MRDYTRLMRAALLVGLAAAFLFTFGCGISNNSTKNNNAALTTYLYVADRDVAQLRVESDGTLTALSPATVAGPATWGTNFLTVDPSGQYLFASSALDGGTSPVNQYVIGSDGTLIPNASPAVSVTGWNQLTFTPDGRFTFIPDFQDGVIDAYSLSSSGTLAQVSQLSVTATPANVQPTAVDPSGRFLYFFEAAEIGYSNTYFYSLMEYAISADGVLTPLSPNYVAAPGYTYSLTVAPNGFLYFTDTTNGRVTAFWIDESSGQLANAGSFATGTGPGSTPTSIAFDPTGAYAYVTNSIDNSVTQFTVNASTGALTMNGPDVPTGWGPYAVVVDPSGKFAFVTNDNDRTISQFTISNGGRLAANGTFALGTQSYATAMAFAQR